MLGRDQLLGHEKDYCQLHIWFHHSTTFLRRNTATRERKQEGLVGQSITDAA
jgi:hypothetical protein